jgi:hypothetical protein
VTEKRKKSVVGRIIVLVLFSVVVAYFGIAIFGSIVTHLYGSPPAEDADTLGLRERTWCIRTIVGLRDELEGQVTLEMQHPKREGDPAARWELWKDGWHDKLTTATERCVGVGNATLDRAYNRLAQLEAGYAAAVDGMIRTRTGVSPGLQEALSQLKKQR